MKDTRDNLKAAMARFGYAFNGNEKDCIAFYDSEDGFTSYVIRFNDWLEVKNFVNSLKIQELA